jgi:ribosomal protein L11 methyltransferase
VRDYGVVRCRIPAAVEEDLTAAMAGWPVLGCQVEDAGGELAVTVFLAPGGEQGVDAVSAGLCGLGASEVRTGRFAETDWLGEYRKRVVPTAIGARFWVDPHPDRPTPPPPGRHHLLVEPRQAFGTGSHESTRLIVELLESEPLAGRRVLDVGTGSGILALAADALGAASVVAFDIDVDAVFVARQTTASQPVPRHVSLFAGSVAALRSDRAFDLILANLLPAQLEPLLRPLRRRLASGGTLVISGLLLDQPAAFEGELTSCGLSVEGMREEGEWVALACRRTRRPATAQVRAHAALRPVRA